MGETIHQYLNRMAGKDMEKGGDGWRSTSEIAEYFATPVPKMRRQLDRLFNAGSIDCTRDGNHLYWRV